MTQLAKNFVGEMKLIHHIFFLFIFAIHFFPAKAQDTHSLTPERSGEIIQEEDSLVPVHIILSDSMVKLIPAFDIYKSWDTINIHPYKFDLTKKCDSAALLLCEGSVTGFCTPFISKINSDFGQRRRIFHYGIDFHLQKGDSVQCAFDGKVRIAKRSRSYGFVVVVRHKNGLETIYAHLSKILVKINQEVISGETIALGGNTGRSTGAHLHFEMRYKGEPLNPNDVIDFQKDALKSDTLIICKERFKYLAEIRRAKYYTVRKGDSLGRIAQRYGTSISKLCKLNGIKQKSIIRPGQRLRVA